MESHISKTPSITVRVSEFPIKKPKIRSTVVGAYHPIIHMNVHDMRHIGAKCGGAVLVCANYQSIVSSSKQPMTVVAIAWPQKSANRSQVRLSQLLRRSLSYQKDLQSLVSEGPAESLVVRSIRNSVATFPEADSVSLRTSEVGIEQLSATVGRALEFPSHLEVYLQNILEGRLISVGTSVSCPVLGSPHTFWIHDIQASEVEADVGVFRVGTGTSCKLEQRTVVEDPASRDGERLKHQGQLDQFYQSFGGEVGGLGKELRLVSEMIFLPLHAPETFTDAGLRAPKGVLLYGPPGTGKTLIAKTVAKKCRASFFSINGSELLSSVVGESEGALRRIFEKALDDQPSVIFIDEIDALCPKRERSTDEIDKRMVSTLLTLMDGVDADLHTQRVVVLAATNRPNALDPAIRRPGRLDREIEIGIPSYSARCDILRCLLRKADHALTDEAMNEIASKAHGFVGADMKAMCQAAGLHALRRVCGLDGKSSPAIPSISPVDMRRALAETKPSAMREILVEVPTVQWEDIGGQASVKQLLKEAVEWPLQRPEVFQRMGIRPPRGILLYGPPGCSKTLMAKAVATESGMNFIAVKGPELFNKWVGESERAVAETFRKARAAAPSIIFFDEIDALAAQRSGSSGESGGVADRVLSQILTELDGIRPLKQVIVLAATNRPDLVDPALRRPGRIDRCVYVTLPDAEARREILHIHTRNTPLGPDVDLNAIADCADGFSGAEIAALSRESALFAIEDDKNTEFVAQRHFLKALANVTPQTTKGMLQFFENFDVSH